MQKEMIYKAVFVQKTYLSLTGKTIVCFGENLEFTVGIQKKVCETFCVENIKGDLEITKITSTDSSGEIPVFYNKIAKTFSPALVGNGAYTFYISANILLKELCAFNYHFHVPVERLRLLKLYHFFKDEIVLEGFKKLKFTYYIKRIKNNELDGCDIEVQIENPFDVEIEGKKGDFTVGHYATKDIDMSLSFVFYPTILQTPNQNNLSNSMMKEGIFGIQQRKILSPLHSTGATATPNLPNLTKIISPENTPKTSPSPQSTSTTAKSTTPLTPTPAPASKPQNSQQALQKMPEEEKK